MTWDWARGTWPELMLPLPTSQAQFGNQMNPDISVPGYPGVLLFANSDVLFQRLMAGHQPAFGIGSRASVPNDC